MKRIAALRLFACAGAVISTGCFSYVPVELGALPEGNEVRFEMTRVGFASLPPIPNQNGPTLTGRIVRRDPGQLLVRVPLAYSTDGLVTRAIGQDLTIPADQIVQLEWRQFDRARTGILVGGVLAGAVATWLGFHHGSNDTPEIPEDPFEEEAGVGRAVIRFFSLSFR